MKTQAAHILLVSAILLSFAEGLSAQPDEAEHAKKIEALIKNLRSVSPAGRIQAAQSLGQMGEQARPAARQLCIAMMDASPKVRAEAAHALEKVHPKLYPHVVTLRRDRDKSNHWNACVEVAAMGEEGRPAVPILRAHLTYNLGVMQKYKPRKLSELRKVLAIREDEPLEISLKQYDTLTDIYLNHAALVVADVTTLSRVASDEPAVAEFIAGHTLQHPSDIIRYVGVKTLGCFGKHAMKYVPTLKKMKLDPSKDIREAATEALSAIVEK